MKLYSFNIVILNDSNLIKVGSKDTDTQELNDTIADLYILETFANDSLGEKED